MTKELQDFIDNLDENTPEKILLQPSKKELKDPVKRLSYNLKAMALLNGATLIKTYFWEKALMMTFLKDGKIYNVDWCDGYGVTVSEYIQDGYKFSNGLPMTDEYKRVMDKFCEYARAQGDTRSNKEIYAQFEDVIMDALAEISTTKQ